jgi:hypothetical protein
MSCSPSDLRDYFLGELEDDRRRQVGAHLHGCSRCHEELERLRATEAALLTLRDEEIPQRIGFVSDKIFEPSRAGRWWRGFWGSAARVAFASAAMLSAAIVVHALRAPAPAPVPVRAAAVQAATPELAASFERRLQEAVRAAVAESEARQDRKTAALLAAAEQRHQLDFKAVQLAAEENLDMMRKRFNVRYRASADFGDTQ